MTTPVEAEVINERGPRPGQLVEQESALSVVPRDAQAVAVAAAAMQKVRSGMQLAREFPRNEDECRSKVMKLCVRKSFAEDAEYRFRVGGREIVGPSIDLVSQISRCWGNCHTGHQVLVDTDTERTISCYAYDLETGYCWEQQVSFKKMHQRKDKDGVSRWVPITDERDLRWTTNSNASIAIRNCLEKVLPTDLIQDAQDACRRTKTQDARQDPEAYRKQLVDAFVMLQPSIGGQELTDYLGHPIAQLGPDEMVAMRGLWKALKDKATTWTAACGAKAVEESLAQKSDRALPKSGAELARLRKARAEGREEPKAKKQWSDEANHESSKKPTKGKAPAEPKSDRQPGDDTGADDDKDVTDDGTTTEAGQG